MTPGLLPQPGGFEGLTFVVELANTHDHPVPDREQLVVGRANLGATRRAAAHLGCLDQNLIASAVDDPLDLISVVSEAFAAIRLRCALGGLALPEASSETGPAVEADPQNSCSPAQQADVWTAAAPPRRSTTF